MNFIYVIKQLLQRIKCELLIGRICLGKNITYKNIITDILIFQLKDKIWPPHPSWCALIKSEDKADFSIF